jgi:DNA-binding transcriptional ArsR family regulator
MNNQSLAEEVTRLHADLCSALADPRRILLIYALADGPKNVGELTSELGISQPSTSRHLKVLRERGLATGTRDGTVVEYELTDHRLIDALDMLRTILRDRMAYRASLLDAGISDR